MKFKMQELKGTEKQIAWANEIRESFVSKFWDDSDETIATLSTVVNDETRQKRTAKLERKIGSDNLTKILNHQRTESATFWINNRDNLKYEIERLLHYIDQI